MVGRKTTLSLAQMPFAERAGGITSIGQQLGQRDFPLNKPIDRCGNGHRSVACAHRIPSRQQRSSARCALSLDVEVEQAHAFASELVNARRGRATQYPATIAAELAVTEVVGEHENNI